MYKVKVEDEENCYEQEEHRVTVAAQQDKEVFFKWKGYRLHYSA